MIIRNNYELIPICVPPVPRKIVKTTCAIERRPNRPPHDADARRTETQVADQQNGFVESTMRVVVFRKQTDNSTRSSCAQTTTGVEILSPISNCSTVVLGSREDGARSSGVISVSSNVSCRADFEKSSRIAEF